MQTKSLFFRSNKVRRIYDKNSNTLIYVSYRCVPAKKIDMIVGA
eukprot:COSAG02_NODE_284_length_25691_cov_14.733354_5_plen_44_part_00